MHKCQGDTTLLITPKGVLRCIPMLTTSDHSSMITWLIRFAQKKKKSNSDRGRRRRSINSQRRSSSNRSYCGEERKMEMGLKMIESPIIVADGVLGCRGFHARARNHPTGQWSRQDSQALVSALAPAPCRIQWLKTILRIRGSALPPIPCSSRPDSQSKITPRHSSQTSSTNTTREYDPDDI